MAGERLIRVAGGAAVTLAPEVEAVAATLAPVVVEVVEAAATRVPVVVITNRV
jgi:hypothetical protein